MDVMGRLRWDQYAIPLPKENEHYYTKSIYGPLKKDEKGKFARVNASYLLDIDEKIVGFEFTGRKFIFSNVINHSGNILPNARFVFKKEHVDEIIRKCVDIYDEFKEKEKNTSSPKPLFEYKFTPGAMEPIIGGTPDEFTKLPGKEYGMRKQTHRGATFLENEDRGLIGFRYHGKDFFINEETNKLSKRYKPEMAFTHNDISDIEKAIDKYLTETDLGLSDQPSAEDVKETKNILHDNLDMLYDQYQKTIKSKGTVYNKLQATKQENAGSKKINKYKNTLTHLNSFLKHLENNIKNAERDIEALSNALPSLNPQEIKRQKELLNKLKKLSMNVLSQASKANDMETLYTQYQKLKDIDREIETIEKSIAEDQELEFIDHPDDEPKPEINKDNINQPVENLQDQSVENLQDQPVENLQDQPVENLQDQPVENLQDQPIENLQDQPIENLQDQSIKNLQDQPVENLQNQPIENLKPSTKQGVLHNFYQRILNLIGSLRNALHQVLESISPLLRKKNTSNDDEESGVIHEKP